MCIFFIGNTRKKIPEVRWMEAPAVEPVDLLYGFNMWSLVHNWAWPLTLLKKFPCLHVIAAFHWSSTRSVSLIFFTFKTKLVPASMSATPLHRSFRHLLWCPFHWMKAVYKLYAEWILWTLAKFLICLSNGDFFFAFISLVSACPPKTLNWFAFMNNGPRLYCSWFKILDES